MQERYKITTSSEETVERMVITVKMEFMKIKVDDSNRQDARNNFLDCLAALHRNLLSIIEEIHYSSMGFTDQLGNSKNTYFFKILNRFSRDEMIELRKVLFDKSM